jgi:diacylglycerol kinase
MGLYHSTKRSFSYAFQGLFTAIKNEPNLRIHLTAAAVTLTAAYLLNFSVWEWLILAFTIFYVITLELLNTVMESVVDLVSPDIRPQAKIAKDVSAACVLVGAMMAVIVALLLFVPKIVALF